MIGAAILVQAILLLVTVIVLVRTRSRLNEMRARMDSLSLAVNDCLDRNGLITKYRLAWVPVPPEGGPASKAGVSR